MMRHVIATLMRTFCFGTATTLAFDPTTCPVQVSKLAAKVYKYALKCAQQYYLGQGNDRYECFGEKYAGKVNATTADLAVDCVGYIDNGCGNDMVVTWGDPFV